ncbi:hypothetical protein ACJKIH_03085 [Brucella pseudogrignonensis]|uniref:hypothetical protein n=1 Tax=Brucella pseudogrignonensis TaxID=419475 RepID=UPI0038B60D91
MTVLQLFRRGLDTYDIAKRIRSTEADVLKMLHILRSREKRKWARFGSFGGKQ